MSRDEFKKRVLLIIGRTGHGRGAAYAVQAGWDESARGVNPASYDDDVEYAVPAFDWENVRVVSITVDEGRIRDLIDWAKVDAAFTTADATAV